MSYATVFTLDMESIGTTIAVAGGIITSLGDVGSVNYGHYWNLDPSGSLDVSKRTVFYNALATGKYTSNLTGLIPGERYWVFAWGQNIYGGLSVNTTQGQRVYFTAGVPTVTTGRITDIKDTTATALGDITTVAGATQHGHIWKRSGHPNLDINADIYDYDGITENGEPASWGGEFTSSLTGLTPFADYFYRAYATNTNGTGLGRVLRFTAAVPLSSLTPGSFGISTTKMRYVSRLGNERFIEGTLA